jgi:hypothetical protein
LEERLERHLNPKGPIEVLRKEGGGWLLINEDRVSGGDMIKLATDITARKQAKENPRVALVDAERADQAKSECLATMCPELRALLNAIIRFSETM